MRRSALFTLYAIMAYMTFQPVRLAAEDEGSSPGLFQDRVLRIHPTQTQGSIPRDVPFIGALQAFSGTAIHAHDGVRFNIMPDRRSRHYRRPVRPLSKGTLKGPANQWLIQRYLEATSTHYGPVEVHDIIPVFGTLYRVDGIRKDDNGGMGALLTLRKLASDEWPEGIEVDPYAYQVTNGGHLDVHGLLPLVEFQDVSYDVSKAKYQVTVTQPLVLAQQFANRREVSWSEVTVDIESGSLLSIQCGCMVYIRVTNVVAPNSRKNIPGWVEFRRLWPTVRPFGIAEIVPVRR